MKKFKTGIRLASAICVITAGFVVPAYAGTLTFKTPDAAVEALVTAMKDNNKDLSRQILGIGKDDNLISSGDDVADQNARKAFLKAYDEKHKIRKDGQQANLLIGNEEWPFPIPVIHEDMGDAWRFDASQGKQELLFRRIGRNELDAIKVCEAYADAQNDYAIIMRKKNGVSSYARKIISTPGKKDGLYWKDETGEDPSPLGELFAAASAEGYGEKDQKSPYHGYYYKILTAQGASAPGSAVNYIANGKMIGGYGLVAWPAEYGSSGIKSFMINHGGVVYEKDLGPDTEKTAINMAAFDPGEGWAVIRDEK